MKRIIPTFPSLHSGGHSDTNGAFSYQVEDSINQSLKRVKISTSMGELRLDRDFENLISEKKWEVFPPLASGPGVPTSIIFQPQSQSRRIAPSEINYCDNSGNTNSKVHAKLSRDPVNPLKLRLVYLLPPSVSVNPHYSYPTWERWTFWIQVPRMYPHVPPAVSRVSRDIVPNADEFFQHVNATSGNDSNLHGDIHNHIRKYWINDNTWENRPAAAIIASSLMQSHVEPPTPERISIRPLPPYTKAVPGSSSSGSVVCRPSHECRWGGDTANDSNRKKYDNENMLAIDAETAVYEAWSPISSLGELLEFLMTVPGKRRIWWSHGQFREKYWDQVRLIRQNSISSIECGGKRGSGFGKGNSTAPSRSTQESSDTSPMISSPERHLKYPRNNQHSSPFTSSKHLPPSADDMDHDGREKKHYTNGMMNSGINHNFMMIDDPNHELEEGNLVMMATADISSPEKRANPLATNRFDVGYDRGSMLYCHHQHHQYHWGGKVL